MAGKGKVGWGVGVAKDLGYGLGRLRLACTGCEGVPRYEWAGKGFKALRRDSEGRGGCMPRRHGNTVKELGLDGY